MSSVELLPTHARFLSEQPVTVEIRGASAAGHLRVWHLGELVSTHEISADTTGVELGVLPTGGYGIEWSGSATDADPDADTGLVRTAVEVAAGDAPVQRYGFVANYAPNRDWTPVTDLARRLHLTDIQCYDWAFRHADLLGSGEVYTDALDQQISLATVRDLTAALTAVGSRALGYAAVYAVGTNEWDQWADAALLTASGTPYALADFLQIVDPADDRWLAHLCTELAQASEQLGFHGFHLDQYGYPKHAVRPDGATVDVADAFATMITQVRLALPTARLVFNQVNDFPTWRTATSPQDAVYIEPWAPSTTLQHLADTAADAHAAGGGKPVILAAYQHVYDSAPAAAADLATAFTMAALASRGATQLLAGEGDRILVDPYYVRNHPVEESTAALLTRWYDFLVEHTEVLFPPGPDVTRAMAGPYNDDLDVTFDAHTVTEQATAGAVWRTIRRTGPHYVMHLINLAGQVDTDWDSPRLDPDKTGPGRLRVRRTGTAVPRIRVGDPDDAHGRLVDVEVDVDGDYATAALPDLFLWQLVVIDLTTN